MFISFHFMCISTASCPDMSREIIFGIEELTAMRSRSEYKSKQLFDVVILGAGPAGALCAAELSKMKYKILLIDGGHSSTRIEGLSARAVRLLQSKQMFNALSVVSDSLPRNVIWGEQVSAENGEHLVVRPQFDQGLCADAQKAGTQLIKGRVTLFVKDEASSTWRVTLTDKRQARCRFLVDARGRQVNPSNKENAAPQNIALCSYVENMAAEPGTQVQAIENGWLWLARPNKQTPVWAQLMLHKGVQKISKQDISKTLRTNIESATRQSGLKICGQPVSRGADFRLNVNLEDSLNPLRLGDACAAFDPLSGHGMFWAFSSAMTGAAIANTLLKDSSESTQRLCREFYEQRLQSTYWRQARIGRDFYRLEKDRSTPFWQVRKHWPDNRPAHEELVIKPKFDCGPAIENDLVVEQERLLLPGEYGPSAWFGSISLVRTIRKLQEMPQTESMDIEQFRKICVPTASVLEARQFKHWLESKNITEKIWQEIS